MDVRSMLMLTFDFGLISLAVIAHIDIGFTYLIIEFT